MSAAPCPSWCRADHSRDGRVHRVEAGTTPVDGKKVSVVVLQVPEGDPSLVVSGLGLYVELQPGDHEDAAWLFFRLGAPELAGLIDRAAEILAEAARAEVA